MLNKTIYLKTDSFVFEEVFNKRKTFEIRKNDRDFQIGDTLILQETKYTGQEMYAGAELIYTGREVKVKVISILKGPFTDF